MPEHTFQKEMQSIDKWIHELRSLGVSAKKTNLLNDSGELRDLAENINRSLYQEHKAAYTDSSQ